MVVVRVGIDFGTTETAASWTRRSLNDVKNRTDGGKPWLTIDASISPVRGIDASIGHPGTSLLDPDQLSRLADEIGGPSETWSWIEGRATQANQPIAAIVQHEVTDNSMLTVVGPRPWSPERLIEWVTDHLDAVKDLVGPADVGALTSPKRPICRPRTSARQSPVPRVWPKQILSSMRFVDA